MNRRETIKEISPSARGRESSDMSHDEDVDMSDHDNGEDTTVDDAEDTTRGDTGSLGGSDICSDIDDEHTAQHFDIKDIEQHAERMVFTRHKAAKVKSESQPSEGARHLKALLQIRSNNNGSQKI